MDNEMLFRYMDDWICDEEFASGIRVRLFEYKVQRKTNCGVWILDEHKGGWDAKNNRWGRLRFVKMNCAKMFAYPSKEQALAGYIARKNRQISILSGQLEFAKDALAKAQEGDVV